MEGFQMALCYLRNIPDELYRDFKVACAYYGINKRETIMNHMRAVVWDYQHKVDEPNKLNVFKRRGGKTDD
jgi:hypothetical protein